MADSEPPGLLAPQQRKWLRGELNEELSRAQKNQRRYRLRQRLKTAIEDFRLLQSLDEDDQKSIFDEVSETAAGFKTSDAPLDSSISAMLGFLYGGVGKDVFQAAVEQTLLTQTWLNLVVKKREHCEVSVNISIDVTDTASEEELVARLEEGNDLADQELLSLLLWDRLSADEFNNRVSSTTETSPEE